LAMKSNSSEAIFNPWASTRFMMGFLGVERRLWVAFRDESSKKRAKGQFSIAF
jgi:hypothetical protein